MKKILCLIITAIILLTLCTLPTLADVGNVFDDVGGGGFDFGGGDFDWGDSDSGGVIILGDIFDDDDGGFVGIIVFAVIAIAFFVFFKNVVGNAAKKAGVASSHNRTQTEEAITDAVRARDPLFSPEQFKTYASDVFIRVQEAWESKDWKVIRPFESDQLFALHRAQLEEYIKNKKTNYMNAQNIKSVELTDYRIAGNNEVLSVKLNAGLLDFILDDETGKLLAGSQTERQDRNYYLEFIRTAGTQTQAGGDLKSDHCPSCGAPVSVNAGGYCEYCGSVITSGTYGWILNVYTKW